MVIFMSKKRAGIVIFSIGACGYGLIEILWRGHTHWSMLTAGGMSFLGLSAIADKMKRSSLLKKAIAGCALITAIELVFGVIFNIILRRDVWDYSKMPLNLGGQICALYSFFWLLLSMLFIPLAALLNRRLKNK